MREITQWNQRNVCFVVWRIHNSFRFCCTFYVHLKWCIHKQKNSSKLTVEPPDSGIARGQLLYFPLTWGVPYLKVGLNRKIKFGISNGHKFHYWEFLLYQNDRRNADDLILKPSQATFQILRNKSVRCFHFTRHTDRTSFFWYLFSFLMQQLHMRDFFYLCQMERPREKYVFYWTISPIGGHYFLLLFILLVWSLCNLNSYIHVIDFIKLHQIEIQWIQSSQWFHETMQFVSYEINLM